MSRPVVAAPVVLLAAGLLAAQPLEVVEYKSAEGRFVTLFPGEVTVSTDKRGTTPTTTHRSSPAPGLSYSVTYFDLPADIPPNAVKNTARQFAASIKGKVVSAKDVTVGPTKVYGREVIIQRADSHLRQLVVVAGRRMYLCVVGGVTKDDVTTKTADRFIAGFEVTR